MSELTPNWCNDELPESLFSNWNRPNWPKKNLWICGFVQQLGEICEAASGHLCSSQWAFVQLGESCAAASGHLCSSSQVGFVQQLGGVWGVVMGFVQQLVDICAAETGEICAAETGDFYSRNR